MLIGGEALLLDKAKGRRQARHDVQREWRAANVAAVAHHAHVIDADRLEREEPHEDRAVRGLLGDTLLRGQISTCGRSICAAAPGSAPSRSSVMWNVVSIVLNSLPCGASRTEGCRQQLEPRRVRVAGDNVTLEAAAGGDDELERRPRDLWLDRAGRLPGGGGGHSGHEQRGRACALGKMNG